MAVLNINPTRMELNKIKGLLITARKGHKLLKDKRDELMRQFLNIAKTTLRLRKQIEKDILSANFNLEIAKARTSKQAVKTALLLSKQESLIKLSTKNIMGVTLPSFILEQKVRPSDSISYGFSQTSIHLDKAINSYNKILPSLIELAENEKTISILADEIEQTRRRVNALEHLVIPNYQDTIRFITLKLDETERGNIARLSRAKN
ncbi:MAG: V-type ATP synthase subunit D [Oscillospiraceae bacterium]|nr:V-type ATP synthase subunit D [Oscillospiraceae bacterium]